MGAKKETTDAQKEYEYKLPLWNTEKLEESLQAVYQWAIKNAEAQIAWYAKRKLWKRRGSQIIRASSIALAALGGLCPLLDAVRLLPWLAALLKCAPPNNVALAQWGYVFFAVALAIYWYDKLFGLSTGWMRYITTQMAVEKALKEFQYDWLILRTQLNSQADTQNANTQALLQKMRDFTSQIEALVKQETDAWVLEFQNNLSQLEKVLKAEVENRKPGSIKVTVSNALEYNSVSLRLKGVQHKELIGTTQALLDAIPPGVYEVEAVGSKENKTGKDSKVVEVQPNAIAIADLTLKAS